MKKAITVITLTVLLFLAGGIYYYSISGSNAGQVNGLKILNAAKSYVAEQQAQGMAVPESVSLRTLIKKGHLNETEVTGLEGLEVSVSLSANKNHPKDVLVRARLPDGKEIVVLVDGTVQQVNR